MTKQTSDTAFDICVVGGGLVGLMAALKLSTVSNGRQRSIVLVAPKQKSKDGRTTAMMMPAIRMLEALELWDAIKPHTAALKTMRLIDGTKRLIRSPVTDFRASEINQEAFGYNIPNNLMIEALEAKLTEDKCVTRIDASVSGVEFQDETATITLDDDSKLDCKLVVAADGRDSLVRKAAGIETSQWSYPQTALVLNFAHTQPHGGVSTEFHTETGPFTQVPLPATGDTRHRSSLVWVVRPEEAQPIQAASLEDLSKQVEERLQSCLGKVSIECAPQAFPLSGMTAKSFGANRTVLVGEAGHVFPPIGAQGFNLGLRDVDALADLLSKQAGDPGSEAPTAEYSRRRTADVHLRTNGIDLMNRSLLTSFLPVQAVRALGIGALGNIGWLRKLAMHQGMGFGGNPLKSITGSEKGQRAADLSR